MAKEPNILILMPDQQRADCLSCAGHPQIKTPNMDRLAQEGMRSAQATTASPICMPASLIHQRPVPSQPWHMGELWGDARGR